jgi:hypothetical protein
VRPLGLGAVGGERGGGGGGVRVGGVDEVARRGVGGGVSGACAGGVHGEKQLDALGWIGRTWTVIERRWPARTAVTVALLSHLCVCH